MSYRLLGLGEPAHGEPAFGHLRTDVLERLAGAGCRAVALEIDRVAALAVDDYVRAGVGTLDTAMAAFSHGWGAHPGNRRLVAWLRAHNTDRPYAERLAFHGFDTPAENYRAPSPRPYLEAARDHLGLRHDIAGPAGDDDRWSRPEAILDAAQSPGASAAAAALREIGDDLLAALDERRPADPAADGEWHRVRLRLVAGLGLLRYHRQAAEPMPPGPRIAGLIATRNALMDRNLLDLRDAGPMLVCGHNAHLQRARAAGTVDRFVAGTLGRSDALGLDRPAPPTYEGALQARVGSGAALVGAKPDGVPRTDVRPEQGYQPLDAGMVAAADAFLHVSGVPGRFEPGRVTLG